METLAFLGNIALCERRPDFLLKFHPLHLFDERGMHSSQTSPSLRLDNATEAL